MVSISGCMKDKKGEGAAAPTGQSKNGYHRPNQNSAW